MKLLRLSVLLSVSVVLPSIAETDLEFFERKVRPLLAASCFKCHSVDSKKLKGDLLLDHISTITKGGDTGPALVPGEPDKSLLVESVRYKNVDLQMPPKGKLPASDIEVLEKWVAMGAPWPDEPVPAAGNRETFDWKARKKAHWSWSTLQQPNPPEAPTGWEHPIDAFVHAKLKASGLGPAPSTDRRTWIRRVTLDLTGLPPRIEEVDAFLADQEDEAAARERVVDRLLASSAFGERWARHWLDLVRYAESCGHEFDYNLFGAPAYRDYVIRAFNANVPYDDFVREHVAGDLLKNPRRHPEEGTNESIVGTGFWFLHEAVHAPTDVRKDEADRMDNQIDVFSKTFLGLTVSCSRCHDHKFDAIPASDYYALAGYLQSSRMDRAMLDPKGRIGSTVREIKALRPHEAGPAKDLETYLLATPAVQAWTPPAKAPQEKDLLKPEGRQDILFEDFESGYDGWTLEGEAFGKQPSKGTEGRQQPVSGFRGKGLVNSYVKGDGPKGRMRSKAFVIERRYVNLLVGGGHHKGKTCVNLLVGGQAVRTTEGRGPTDREALSPRSWDLEEFQGKTAQLEIVDQESGGWGHINVDHIVFSDQATLKPPAGKPARSKRGPAVAAVAGERALDPKKLTALVQAIDDAKPTHPLHILKELQGARDIAAKRDDIASRLAAEEMTFQAALDATAHAYDYAKGPGDAYLSGQAFGHRHGAMSSRAFAPRMQGSLRTPTFLLDRDVWFRVRAHKGEIRLIIDNYMMQTFNGLLFGGTRTHNLDTKGAWQWHKLGNSMWHGHRAYLEFNDYNDGFIEVSHVVVGNRPPEPPNAISLAVARDPSVKDAASLARAMAGALRGAEWALDNGFRNPEVHGKILTLQGAVPNPKTVLAITDGSGEDEHVFIRGSHKNLGEVVPRRFLIALGGEDQPAHGTDGSGRLELVERMLADSNPYPARVMVNRLWHHLFGRGIVPTVDDFGEMGQAPSHPELLDWLASDFRKDWDVKRAIKQMVLSATYRQSSAPADIAAGDIASIDPDNHLLHRMPIRRLQAEAIRDSVLAVSGRLNRQMYGGPVMSNLTSFQQGRGRPKSGPLDGDGRRSIYLSVRRNFLNSFLWTYDFPTPFSSMGRRTVSNVPAQALVMMNDPFVVAEARRWGATIAKFEGDTAAKVERVYLQALARPPSEHEVKKAAAFIGEAGNDPAVWADFCHVIFNLKEFIYLP